MTTVPLIVSSVIFLVALGLILTEKFNRTIVGFAGAALMLESGLLLGFYTEEEAIAAIDYHTLGLLLGMMILVALLEPTGMFQYLAVWAGKLSKGRPVFLLVLLGGITTIVSMFLDNVTTIVFIAPVTILICEILGLNPTPYLLSEALLSNTGGVATLVGDPPNILIGSAAGFTFVDFLTHALPIVLVCWFIVLGVLRILFRRELAVKPRSIRAIKKLNPAQALDDPGTARKVLIVLGVAVVFFFVAHYLEISSAFIAMAAAAAALAWIRPDINQTLRRIEWSVLAFFASLFIMVGGLEAAGVFDLLIRALESADVIAPVLLGVITIWVVAGLSAVVDNIPITIAMIPIIQGLGNMGMEVQALWWALAFGAGFGGNGTIIGSTANVVVATLSEKTRTPITAKLWNKRGLPVMLVACLAASILFVVLYPWLSQ